MQQSFFSRITGQMLIKMFSSLLALTLLGCSGDAPNQGETKRDNNNNPTLSEATGGPPDAAKVISAVFKTKKSGCTKGFGICQVDPDASGSDGSPKKDFKKAMLTLDIENDSIADLEFYDEIEHFSNEFIIEESINLPNFLGYKMIVLLPGTYTTLPDKGQFGAVKVRVTRGAKI